MIFKILITVLALAPNALIGYVYFNRDAIIQQQKDALMKTLSGQLTEQLSKQTKALTEIATGEVGGPMEAFGALISNNAGIEKRPITFSQDGMKHSVQAGDLVDQSCEAIAGAVNENEPISLDNVPHPSGARLPLAKAIKTSINVFGITWNDDSGIRNGHINTFSWSN